MLYTVRDEYLAVPPCLNAPKGLHSLSGAVSRASRPVGGWCPSVRGIRRLQPGAAVSAMPHHHGASRVIRSTLTIAFAAPPVKRKIFNAWARPRRRSRPPCRPPPAYRGSSPAGPPEFSCRSSRCGCPPPPGSPGHPAWRPPGRHSPPPGR